MTNERKPDANRDVLPRRLMLAIVLATAGMTSGTVLGHLVVGGGLNDRGGATETFAAFSSNPRSLTPDIQPQEPCYGCADSYGVAARLDAEREARAYEAYYRNLGHVAYDDAQYADAEGDYRYGGRFPDAEPIAMVSPVQLAEAPAQSENEAGDVAPVPEESDQPL